MDDFAIVARGLGKRYIRGTSALQHDSLRDLLRAGVRSLIPNSEKIDKSKEMFWALQDASFEIRRGESVGVIGLNGAGKSTLLKILSRIVTPTTGSATIKGRLGALLEVGTGFHPELTGRENTFLYGSILGMSRQEVARKYDKIVEFSEIGEFIDTPVKRYSSGMYVRLAFAVAAHLDPDVLLLDEVLAVGDFTFQRKCIDFAQSLEKRGATILVVSHNMFSIKSMCERVIYLKKGRVVFDGPTDEGLALYENDSRLAAPSWFRGDAETAPIQITDVQLMNERGEKKTVFEFGERMRVRARYETRRPIKNPNFLVSFTRSDNTLCTNFSSTLDEAGFSRIQGVGEIELLTPPIKLTSDLYQTSIVVREDGFKDIICAQLGETFHVSHPVLATIAFGVFHESGEWRADSLQTIHREQHDEVG